MKRNLPIKHGGSPQRAGYHINGEQIAEARVRNQAKGISTQMAMRGVKRHPSFLVLSGPSSKVDTSR